MIRKTLAERFAERVNVNGPVARPGLTPCHLWTGEQKNGYGWIYISKRDSAARGGTPGLTPAHRVAYFLKHGAEPLPFGLHVCDVKLCANADHIFAGTQQDNVDDMVTKGRQRSGVAKYGADPAEQAVISRAVDLSAEGLSVRAIAAQLASDGIVGRTGRPLSHVQVHRFLRPILVSLAESDRRAQVTPCPRDA